MSFHELASAIGKKEHTLRMAFSRRGLSIKRAEDIALFLSAPRKNSRPSHYPDIDFSVLSIANAAQQLIKLQNKRERGEWIMRHNPGLGRTWERDGDGNIMALPPTTKRYFLATAHIDFIHSGTVTLQWPNLIGPSLADNAINAAMLLALAAHLPLNWGILFTTGEETGGTGMQAFLAEHAKEIRFQLNLDAPKTHIINPPWGYLKYEFREELTCALPGFTSQKQSENTWLYQKTFTDNNQGQALLASTNKFLKQHRIHPKYSELKRALPDAMLTSEHLQASGYPGQIYYDSFTDAKLSQRQGIPGITLGIANFDFNHLHSRDETIDLNSIQPLPIFKLCLDFAAHAGK